MPSDVCYISAVNVPEPRYVLLLYDIVLVYDETKTLAMRTIARLQAQEQSNSRSEAEHNSERGSSSADSQE